MMRRYLRIAGISAGVLALCVASWAASPKPRKMRTPDSVYVGTPYDVVAKMLEMADVHKSDLVYDLGCGDGRIVVLAAKRYGCRGVGYDIDPLRIEDSNANVARNHVEKLVSIEQEDIFTLDLSRPNVILLYLLPQMNVRLIPQLQKLKPGSRIVAQDYGIGGMQADQTIDYLSSEDNVEHTIMLYTTPLKPRQSEE